MSFLSPPRLEAARPIHVCQVPKLQKPDFVVVREETVYFWHGEGDEAVVVGWDVVTVGGQDRIGVLLSLLGAVMPLTFFIYLFNKPAKTRSQLSKHVNLTTLRHSCQSLDRLKTKLLKK
jgi:hypothetical protein